MSIILFVLYLIVAAVCAALAERLVPNTVPGGFFTSAIVGIIGGWLGVNLMGGVGPELAGMPLIPCIIGSAIFVFVISIVSRWIRTRKA
jgi:uncharacterized membrane protein YeaQ/YmgE (transglycosylase-associated protein family)